MEGKKKTLDLFTNNPPLKPTGCRRTSLAFEDVVDLPQQQGHVAELRLPRLAEHVQVLLGDLAGRVEGQGLHRRDDLRKKSRN